MKMREPLCAGLIELFCPSCKEGLITFSSSITPSDWLQVSKEAALDRRARGASPYLRSRQAAHLTIIYYREVPLGVCVRTRHHSVWKHLSQQIVLMLD